MASIILIPFLNILCYMILPPCTFLSGKQYNLRRKRIIHYFVFVRQPFNPIQRFRYDAIAIT